MSVKNNYNCNEIRGQFIGFLRRKTATDLKLNNGSNFGIDILIPKLQREFERLSGKIEHEHDKFFSGYAVKLAERMMRNNEIKFSTALKSIAGIDTEDSWKLRDIDLNTIQSGLEAYSRTNSTVVINALLESIAGIDTEIAWKIRMKFMGDLNYDEAVLKSIVGIDTEKARRLRSQYVKNRIYDDPRDKINICWFVLLSLNGIESEDSWELRESIVQPNFFTLNLLDSFIGCESEKAWKLIEHYAEKELGQKGILDLSIASSISDCLIGQDSERAWRIRDMLKKAGAWVQLINSLIGVGSERAWKLREEFLAQDPEDEDNKKLLALSLAGLNSKKAREMRNRLKADSDSEIMGVWGDWRMAALRKSRGKK
jgi:hypothetical protein